MHRYRTKRLVSAILFAALIPAVAPSADAQRFPPISDAERAITAAPRHPDAPAVVLFEKAELKLMDFRKDLSSHLKVHVRLKILKEEGREYGEVEIPHSRFFRLTDFAGRTTKADGTEVPLAKEDIFEERTSRARKSFVTKAAFPAVEPGAILDYSYKLNWDSIYFLEPWYFHNEIPTLLSEVVFQKPDNMGLQPWYRETSPQKVQIDTQRTQRGAELRAWMEDIPPVPDEPHTFPFEDMSARFMIVPTEVMMSGTRVPFFDSWKTVAKDFESEIYGAARRNDRQAAKKAQGLAAGVSGTRARAAAVYAFVRDEIRWSGNSVFLSSTGADKTLAERQGTSADQALLLQAMLKPLKIKSQLVWATDRREGRPDLSVPNPFWFDHVLVAVDVDGEKVYLDPGDGDLAFGGLTPYVEGTAAMVMDKKEPEMVTLPRRTYENNRRRAELELTLDEEGRLAGTGRLEMTGHHAWSQLRGDDAEALAEAWQAWIGDRFDGYEANEVAVEESIDEQRIVVSWKLEQREDAVLGDEATLEPSRPLGPVSQPFTLEVTKRYTPVFFAFGDRDEVILRLRWPEGWELDLVPATAEHDHEVGAFSAAVDVDEEKRELVLHRRFDVRGAEFAGRDKYAALQQLYGLVEKFDAQDLVLVQP